MTKVSIPVLAVNITNVCNFNCDNCITFSNFNFTGHQLWKDYKEEFLKWSDILEPKSWEIVGGEPMLNPSVEDWISGITEIWPGLPGVIDTNGSTIKADNQKLYNLLVAVDAEVTVRISLHNKARREPMLDTIKKWLHEPIQITRFTAMADLEHTQQTWLSSYANIKGAEWPDCTSTDDWVTLPEHIKLECINVFRLDDPAKIIDQTLGFKLVDKNNITVIIENADHFFQNPIVPLEDRRGFRMQSNNSDPVKAHNICAVCSTFIRGKLYKCHQVGHFAEFDDQYNIELENEDDRALLHSYKPATSDMSYDELSKFIKNLDQPIEQCKFCPETLEFTQLNATAKKMVFVKKKVVDFKQKPKYNSNIN